MRKRFSRFEKYDKNCIIMEIPQIEKLFSEQ